MIKDRTAAFLAFVAAIVGGLFVYLLCAMPAPPQNQSGQQPQGTSTPLDWMTLGVGALAGLGAWAAFMAANRQAGAVEKMLIVVERPNVFCSKIELIDGDLKVGNIPAVFVEFWNGGRAVAMNTYVSIGIAFFENEPTAEDCAKQIHNGPYSIAGGHAINLPMAHTELLERTTAIDVLKKNPTLSLWVYGMITFIDPLSERRFIEMYKAKYIVFGWDQPRPKFPSDFWIFNGVGRWVTNVEDARIP